MINNPKFRKIENVLDLGFLHSDNNSCVFYIKYKNMIRTYHYGQFPFIYCIVEIRLKKYKEKISGNITESTIRSFRKHFEFYKNKS